MEKFNIVFCISLALSLLLTFVSFLLAIWIEQVVYIKLAITGLVSTLLFALLFNLTNED